VKLEKGSVDLVTPDKNNTNIKKVIFRVGVKNKRNKSINLKLHFLKEEKDEEWYPYYIFIPKNIITEIYQLNAKESKYIEYTYNIETYDNDEIIFSKLDKIKVNYELIRKQ
jgi:ribonucleotide reductase alpha subunit